MHQLPLFIPLVFVISVGLASFIMFRALAGFTTFIYIISGWLLIQSILALSGFYLIHGGSMPRFLLLIMPPLIFILLIMSTTRGRNLIGQPDLKWLTMLHILRIPVELVLFWLFIHQAIPQIMTFEGRNPDILVGITAPFIIYFGLIKSKLPLSIILAWNFISLGLLLNIVVMAILSMPSPIQQFGFGQPNIALFYFPFVWLPGCLVPLVILSHLVSIKQLLNRRAMTLRS
jgi:hypothetical protein